MSNAELDRLAQIEQIIELTRTVKERAEESGLRFEAYLLQMAEIALLEQLELEARRR